MEEGRVAKGEARCEAEAEDDPETETASVEGGWRVKLRTGRGRGKCLNLRLKYYLAQVQKLEYVQPVERGLLCGGRMWACVRRERWRKEIRFERRSDGCGERGRRAA
jgi:hypothetical protein